MYFDVYAGFPSFIIDMTLTAGATGTSTADLSHTAGITFILPAHVSFTSASGVFLSQAPSDVASAVPEPATWAMMLIGFGAVGYSLRRKVSRGQMCAQAV
jgi:hypothetical protein